MSSHLTWHALQPPTKEHVDSDAKFMLRKRYGEPVNVDLSESDVPYLEGLADAGVQGAKGIRTILALIAKYGTIHIEEQW